MSVQGVLGMDLHACVGQLRGAVRDLEVLDILPRIGFVVAGIFNNIAFLYDYSGNRLT